MILLQRTAQQRQKQTRRRLDASKKKFESGSKRNKEVKDKEDEVPLGKTLSKGGWHTPEERGGAIRGKH